MSYRQPTHAIIRSFATVMACALAPSTVLANGNVTVQLGATTMTVTGDDQSNDLRITSSNNLLMITGLNGTTVEGLESILFPKSTNLTIKLNEGNDELEVSGFKLKGRLDIRTNDGADIVELISMKIVEDLRYNGGMGDDRLTVTDCKISEDAVIKPSDGIDTVEFFNTLIKRDLDILGPNDDSSDNFTTLDHTTVERDLFCRGGDGQDRVELIDSTINDDCEIRLGTNDDVVLVQNTLIHDRFSIFEPDDPNGNNLDDGDDVVVFDNSWFQGKALVFLGSGDDEFDMINDTQFLKKAKIRMDDGNDDVDLNDVTFAGMEFNHKVSFDGGDDDNDSITATLVNGVSLIAQADFEQVNLKD